MNNKINQKFMSKSPMYSYILGSQLRPKPLYQISKRYFPGGVKEFGHVAKILANIEVKTMPPEASKIIKSLDAKTLNNLSETIEQIHETSAHMIKPKGFVHFYDPSKIANQMSGNYTLKRYLPLYKEHGIAVPFVKEKFPINGIPGSYTLSIDEKEKILAGDSNIISQQAFIKTRYLVTIYGGKPIKTLEDVLYRFDQLFTYDADAFKYQKDSSHYHGIKGLFPKIQHMTALDTYSLSIPVKEVSYGPNINITTKTITMQTHSELCCFKKTHNFLIEQNQDEILVIDSKNKQHLSLLGENAHMIKIVAKQPVTDIIGHHIIGINKKVVYPIDIKRIGEPEIKLPMLSSYSSESPEYFSLLAAQKLYGQLQSQAMGSTNSLIKKGISELSKLLTDKKKGKYSDVEFQQKFGAFTIDFFRSVLNSGNILVEGKSYLPSIIASTTMPGENAYTEMQKINPQFLAFLRKDAESHFNYQKMYPTMAEYQKVSLYEYNLECMTYLKKHGMLDNYYALRNFLCIDDIING